jgi:hypothetical protein
VITATEERNAKLYLAMMGRHGCSMTDMGWTIWLDGRLREFGFWG